ncbi:DEAD/DEAH box helicase [Solirubrobacter ginsenosidimutans]|uniref:DEAD/DEAH box helicase n=1 Tax=Solirubrobacter ginsenosidimutans TaxID=490573 RepID=A0A9X3MVN7_9ACTN|nr:DEAD/DEAH box helicase [Solirubrobacter ginsenosidimutans]MDA0163420.1 DEAD/DEAH box helicase [Solirubrobacter ginsenosidimutans]
MSQKSFAELGLSQPVVGALADRGITNPFAIQALVIEDVLDGVDVLAKSPTGSGKTIAFAAPIIDVLDPKVRKISALILAPTRELVSQIVEESRPMAEARGINVAAVYGGVGFEKQTKNARAAHIVVATPGRLEDLLQRRSISLSNVEILVLDEADRMLDMGFRPAVDRIVRQVPQDRQTLFFSATLDGEVGRIASDYTQDAVRHEHRPPAEHKAEIEHRFRAVDRDTRIRALVEELRAEDRDLALVFVRTKRGADRLVKRLGNEGVRAVAMHGNKSQNQRERALAEFGSGKVDTLVATDVAARGIDVTGISHVINFDAPDDRESYVHRIGRTGRAGKTGIGITFVEAEQARDVGKIAAALSLHHQFERAGLAPATARPHTTAPSPGARRRRTRGNGGRPRTTR